MKGFLIFVGILVGIGLLLGYMRKREQEKFMVPRQRRETFRPVLRPN